MKIIDTGRNIKQMAESEFDFEKAVKKEEVTSMITVVSKIVLMIMAAAMIILPIFQLLVMAGANLSKEMYAKTLTSIGYQTATFLGVIVLCVIAYNIAEHINANSTFQINDKIKTLGYFKQIIVLREYKELIHSIEIRDGALVAFYWKESDRKEIKKFPVYIPLHIRLHEGHEEELHITDESAIVYLSWDSHVYEKKIFNIEEYNPVYLK